MAVKPELVPPAPQLQPAAAPTTELAAGDGALDGGAAGGVLGGVAGGVSGGVPGGVGISAEAPVIGPSYDAAYLHNPPPRYPAAARRLKLEGTTVLRVRVSPEGRPTSVAVETSSGVELLDDAAVEAVRQWSFVPARQGDAAIAAEVNVPVRFRLTGGASATGEGPARAGESTSDAARP